MTNIVDIISLRHELHKFPELSGNEIKTALRIKNYLIKAGCTKFIENLGGFEIGRAHV